MNLSGTLDESILRTVNTLFFHGSRNTGTITTLEPPSPERIFFVTEDLDYAEEYTKKNGERVGSVYVVSLKDGTKIYDPYGDAFTSGSVQEKWGSEFLSYLAHGDEWTREMGSGKDMFNMLMDIVRIAYRYIQAGFDPKKFMESDYVKDADSEFRTHLFDMFGVIEGMFRNREIAEILNESKPNMPWEYNHNLASRLRSLFARDLKEDGYLGFRTEEMTKGRRSYRCYGIFDPEAFGSFFTVPIDQEIARKALAALEDTEDNGEWKNYGKSNDIVREFAEEYRKVHGDGIAESLQIPPNFDDSVEMELRKRLYGEEPEGTVPEKPAGMSDEKWAEIQKRSGEKNREKAVAKAREKAAIPLYRTYGDTIIGWYRKDREDGKSERELRQTYLRDLSNIRDFLAAYDRSLEDLRKKGLANEKVKVDLGDGTGTELSPFGVFKSGKLDTIEKAKLFMDGLNRLLGTVSDAAEIQTGSKDYRIHPNDRKNIWLTGETQHVMCWSTETWESTNKFVYQLWQNAETLGRGDVYGDPSVQTPYCTHSKEHWDDYSEGDEFYRQYWFLKKPEGKFDWSEGNLGRENVVQVFNAMKGKGPELLLAMDDTNGDFLDRNDQHSTDVEYYDEILQIEREIFEPDIQEFENDLDSAVDEKGNFWVSIPENITKFVQEIVIPEGTRRIGAETFNNCMNLRKVTLPPSVKSIGTDAFYIAPDAYNIKEVHISDLAAFCGIRFENEGSNPLSHGARLFLDGKEVTDLEIPAGIRSIGENAFVGCMSLETVTVPDSVTSIGRSAFRFCKNLRKINIPEQVEKIDQYAFQDSGLLEFPIRPDRTNHLFMGPFAFDKCENLKRLEFPKAILSMPDDISGRYSRDMESELHGIPKGAFRLCTSLEEVVLQDGTVAVDRSAFEYCTNLKTVVIPRSVTFISNFSFYGCPGVHLKFLGRTEEEMKKIENFGNLNLDKLSWEVVPERNVSEGVEKIRKGRFQFFVSEDETLSEGLTIPPNPDDEIETELRKLLRPNEENVDTQIDPQDIPPAPEGKDPEKWREWQKASILRKREKEAQSKRDPFLERWGDMLIGWYRNEKKSGKDKNYLKQTYVKDFDTRIDNLKDYEDLVSRYRKQGLKDKVAIQTGDETLELDPIRDFTSKNVPNPEAARLFIQALGNLVHSDAEIDTSVQKYQILPEDRKNIGILASTQDVMCWFTRTYESTNKFVFQLWQNAETLGRGDVYGDPTKQTPYCTHSKEHWNNYSEGDPDYTQYWFLKRPEGNLDFTPGDLSKANVVRAFNAMKGKGAELLIAMDDTTGDFLDRNDRGNHNVEHFDQIARIERKDILDIDVPMKDWVKDGVFSVPEKLRKSDFMMPDIVIPDSATSIGWQAFYGCRRLKSVTIPDSVTSIGKKAFSGCRGLTSVTIPDSVRSIGEWAFQDCNGLTSMMIPGSVTNLGSYTFLDCSGLTSVTIPDSVTSIGWQVFSGCTKLKSVTIPDSVTNIGWAAFSRCSELTSVTIPDSVTSIGDEAFYNCVSLKSVTIPKRFEHEISSIFNRYREIDFTFTGEGTVSEGIDEGIDEGIETSKTQSDMFEAEIADNVREFLSRQNAPYDTLEVSHYEGGDRKYYSDVRVSNPANGKNAWIEVKLNKYSDYGNPSFKYQDGQWSCTTSEDEDDPLAGFFLKAISDNTEKFISFCKDFLGTEDIKLPTDLTPELVQAWKDSGSVDDTENDTQFITEKIRIDGFGEMISRYYSSQKLEPVYYIQVGDDLYLIDRKYNPLDLVTKDGTELKTLAEAHRIGRIQFRMKGIERELADGPKYYYSITSDFKVLSDKNLDEKDGEKPYECSFLTKEKWPMVRGVPVQEEKDGERVSAELAVDIVSDVVGGNAIHEKTRFGFPVHLMEYGGDRYQFCVVRRPWKNLVVFKNDEHEEFFAFDNNLPRREFEIRVEDFARKLVGGNETGSTRKTTFSEGRFEFSLSGEEFRVDESEGKGPGVAAESLSIPPNLEDKIEMEMRKLMYGDEPEVKSAEKPSEMSDEKWAEIQAKSAGKNREKAATKAREKAANDQIFQRYGDVIIQWYRAEKEAGSSESELRQKYVVDLANIEDDFRTYEEYIEDFKSNGLTKERVKVDLGDGKMVEIDPFGVFKTRTLDTMKKANLFMVAFGDLIRSVSDDMQIDTDSKDYTIRPEDRRNLRLLGSTEHVMCWATKTWKSTNKLVYQLWQNAETLGNGGVWGDPSKQTPYCTHSKQHWQNYGGSLESSTYEQYWFLKKPEGEFNWTPGDLNRPNVVKVFNAMKGKGPELLLAMDDTRGDFLDRNDRHTTSVEYFDEIREFEKNTIAKEQIENVKNLKPDENGVFTGIPKMAKQFVETFSVPEGSTIILGHSFSDCVKLKEVHIPDTVTEIYDEAFMNCTSLERVDLPENLERIEPNVFRGCSSLVRIAVPGSVEEISPGVFRGCRSLRDVFIGNGIESIGKEAFSGCESLGGIHLPESVKKIDDCAFQNSGIRKVNIPSGIAVIKSEAFDGCKKLENIEIGDGVQEIGENSFRGCESLVGVSFGTGLRKIGRFAFSGCTSLETAELPDGLVTIGNGAFRGCTSLKNARIPESVRYIQEGAFGECTQLTGKISLGKLDGFEEYAFGESGIEEVETKSVNHIPTGAFSKCPNLKKVVLSDSVYYIDAKAFMKCPALTDIRIPDSVSEIGWSAFMECTGLTEFRFPEEIETIQEAVLNGCRGLRKVEIGKNVRKIKSNAFGNCGFEEIIIPENVTHIDSSAFEGCVNLKKVMFKGNPQLYRNTFLECDSLEEIVFERDVKYAEDYESGASVMYSDVVRKLFKDSKVKVTVLKKVSGEDQENVSEEEEIGGKKSDRSEEFSSGIKIWIDDVREPPPGFRWFKTAEGAIDWMREHGTEGISLFDTDHDAGEMFVMGGDYVNVFRWLDQEGKNDVTVHIHSANPKGANAIREIISRNKDRGWKEIRNRRKRKDAQEED